MTVVLFNYRIECVVVLALFTLFTVCVTLTGDLTPQGEEEDAQTHQTEEHRPERGEEKVYYNSSRCEFDTT